MYRSVIDIPIYAFALGFEWFKVWARENALGALYAAVELLCAASAVTFVVAFAAGWSPTLLVILFLGAVPGMFRFGAIMNAEVNRNGEPDFGERYELRRRYFNAPFGAGVTSFAVYTALFLSGLGVAVCVFAAHRVVGQVLKRVTRLIPTATLNAATRIAALVLYLYGLAQLAEALYPYMPSAAPLRPLPFGKELLTFTVCIGVPALACIGEAVLGLSPPSSKAEEVPSL